MPLDWSTGLVRCTTRRRARPARLAAAGTGGRRRVRVSATTARAAGCSSTGPRTPPGCGAAPATAATGPGPAATTRPTTKVVAPMTTRESFVEGMRAAVGPAAATFVLGVSFGAAADTAGWGVAVPLFFSAFAFSGSAQFSLLTTFETGSAFAAVTSAVLINARYLVMGVALNDSLHGSRAVPGAPGPGAGRRILRGRAPRRWQVRHRPVGRRHGPAVVVLAGGHGHRPGAAAGCDPARQARCRRHLPGVLPAAGPRRGALRPRRDRRALRRRDRGRPPARDRARLRAAGGHGRSLRRGPARPDGTDEALDWRCSP